MNTRLGAFCLLGAALLLADPGQARAEKVLERSAPERPRWLVADPEPSGGRARFVGVKSGARSLEEGLEGAFRDAAGRISAFVQARISARLLVRSTTLERRVADELRSTSQGSLRGAKIEERYWERTKPGGWTVWTLVSFPLAEVEAERRRLESADRALAEGLKSLCAELARVLPKHKKRLRVAGFKETQTQGRYGFSRVLEGELRACLPSGPSGPAYQVTGEYRAGATEVAITARLIDERLGDTLAFAAVSVPAEAVAASWLSEEDDESSIFAGPGEDPAPAPRTGSVAVKSRPEGARIFIDGDDRGRTPAIVQGLRPGMHSVALQLKDHVPYSTQASVEEGARAVVEAALERQTGSLVVRPHPPGARVFLDGEDMGKAPFSNARLPTGSYELALDLDKHKKWRRRFDLGYAQNVVFEPKLEEEDGSIFVLVEPGGADVRVDGGLRGRTAGSQKLKIGSVPAGMRTITVEKEGYSTGEWRKLVKPLETTTINGMLVKEAPPERAPLPRGPSVWSRMRASMRRPSTSLYFNAVGGYVGSGGANIRGVEAVVYFWDSWVGLGTSIVSLQTGYEVQRTDIKREYYFREKERTTRVVGASMLSIFPIQVYLAPWVYTYDAGADASLAASGQLYFSYCGWAKLDADNPGGAEDESDRGPSGTVMDYGVMLHAGTLLAIRAGWVKTTMPAFQQGDSSFTRIDDKRFYVAADFSLSAFVVTGRTP